MIEAILTFGSRRPLSTLLLLLLLTAAAAGGFPRLKIDTSYDSLVSPSDPGFADYERTIEAFGSDNTTVVYLGDEELFTAEKLLRIEDLVVGLEGIPGVERVDSLFGAPNVRDREGVLDAGPLLPAAPETAEEIARARADALHNPILRGNLVSPDGRAVAVNVTVRRERDDPAFNRALYEAIEERIAPLRADFARVFQIGPPRLNVEIERGLVADLKTLTPISVLLLVGTILLFLRTGAAAMPVATAGVSILWTFGFMGYAGLPITLLTAIVPSLVIVIGSTEDVHMIASYLHGIEAGGPADRKGAVAFMARRVGLPIFITSFTTAAGFFSNAVNEVPLIREFAYVASFAMVANLVATIFLLPLLLSVAGPKRSRMGAEDAAPRGLLGRATGALEALYHRHGKAILWGTAGTVLVFGGLSLLVRVSNDPFSYFRADNPLISDAEAVHRHLAGVQVFYLTLEADRAGAFTEPENLARIAAIQGFMEKEGVYDKTVSLSDVLALVNREMHGGDPAFHRVPETRDLVEQYLVLFPRDAVDRYVTPDFRRANVIVRHHLSDSHALSARLARLAERVEGVLGEGMTYRLVGESLMINRAAESLFRGQAQALLLLVGIIFLVMSALFTSPVAGLLSLVPNLIPIVLAFGAMGLLGIPLNPGTATVAAVAVGLAVDDTIHLLYRYNAECRRTPDQERAAAAALQIEIVPVVSTSVSLAAGFLVLLFSEFRIVAQFGALAAATMLAAMAADLLVTPLLMRRLRLVGVWEIVVLEVGREVLTRSPLFRDMTPYQIRKAILLSHMERHPAEEPVVVQGERGRSMYMVLSGGVRVLRREGEREERLADLGAGEIFGEIGYLGETERTATVVTETDTRLLRFDLESTERALRFYPRIAAKLNRNIGRVLGERLVAADRRLVGEEGPGGRA